MAEHTKLQRNNKVWQVLSFLVLAAYGVACFYLHYMQSIRPAEYENRYFQSDLPYHISMIIEDGWYYSRDDVALYLHTYNHLPTNYLTKNEAEALGWNNKEGNLWDVADGCCIGGNKFGNYEGRLPEKSGRTWHECDVNYQGGYRGSDRLLYSTDGLIYYTEDHYNTFTQLY